MADDDNLTYEGTPISAYRVVDLRSILEKHGLSKTGSKKELAARLSSYVMSIDVPKRSEENVAEDGHQEESKSHVEPEQIGVDEGNGDAEQVTRSPEKRRSSRRMEALEDSGGGDSPLRRSSRRRATETDEEETGIVEQPAPVAEPPTVPKLSLRGRLSAEELSKLAAARNEEPQATPEDNDISVEPTVTKTKDNTPSPVVEQPAVTKNVPLLGEGDAEAKAAETVKVDAPKEEGKPTEVIVDGGDLVKGEKAVEPHVKLDAKKSNDGSSEPEDSSHVKSYKTKEGASIVVKLPERRHEESRKIKLKRTTDPRPSAERVDPEDSSNSTMPEKKRVEIKGPSPPPANRPEAKPVRTRTATGGDESKIGKSPGGEDERVGKKKSEIRAPSPSAGNTTDQILEDPARRGKSVDGKDAVKPERRKLEIRGRSPPGERKAEGSVDNTTARGKSAEKSAKPVPRRPEIQGPSPPAERKTEDAVESKSPRRKSADGRDAAKPERKRPEIRAPSPPAERKTEDAVESTSPRRKSADGRDAAKPERKRPEIRGPSPPTERKTEDPEESKTTRGKSVDGRDSSRSERKRPVIRGPSPPAEKKTEEASEDVIKRGKSADGRHPARSERKRAEIRAPSPPEAKKTEDVPEGTPKRGKSADERDTGKSERKRAEINAPSTHAERKMEGAEDDKTKRGKSADARETARSERKKAEIRAPSPPAAKPREENHVKKVDDEVGGKRARGKSESSDKMKVEEASPEEREAPTEPVPVETGPPKPKPQRRKLNLKRKVSEDASQDAGNAPSTVGVDAETSRKRRGWGSSGIVARKGTFEVDMVVLRTLVSPEPPKQEAEEAALEADDGSSPEKVKGLKRKRTMSSLEDGHESDVGEEEEREDEHKNVLSEGEGGADGETRLLRRVRNIVRAVDAEEGEVPDEEESPLSEIKRQISVDVGSDTLRRVTMKTADEARVLPTRGARAVTPSRNPPSRVIFITNLVRPYTVSQLKELLCRTGSLEPGLFWTDRVKSKCIACFETEEQAVETRVALHGVKWPVSNPKKLCVEFSTEDHLKEMIMKDEEAYMAATKGRESAQGAGADQGLESRARDERDRTRSHGDWERKRSPLRLEGAGADVGPRRSRSVDSERGGKRRRTDSATRGRGSRSPGRAVREWDREKIGERSPGAREREREARRRERIREEELEVARAKGGRDKTKPPAKLLDDLFRKTKATPCIYWLPLTPEQMAQKEEERRQRMLERQRRIAEIERSEKERENKRKSRSRSRSLSRERFRSNRVRRYP